MITDAYVRKLCSKEGEMVLTFIDTNPETAEETILESLRLDISGLVFPTSGDTISWTL